MRFPFRNSTLFSSLNIPQAELPSCCPKTLWNFFHYYSFATGCLHRILDGRVERILLALSFQSSTNPTHIYKVPTKARWHNSPPPKRCDKDTRFLVILLLHLVSSHHISQQSIANGVSSLSQFGANLYNTITEIQHMRCSSLSLTKPRHWSP